MRELAGSPGTWSGLSLRLGQFLFAAASVCVMASAVGFASYTAFWYCPPSLPQSLGFAPYPPPITGSRQSTLVQVVRLRIVETSKCDH